MRPVSLALMVRACRRALRNTLDSPVSLASKTARNEADSRVSLASRTVRSARLGSRDKPDKATTLCARRGNRPAPRVRKVNPVSHKANRVSARPDSLLPNRPVSRSRNEPSLRKRKASTRNSPPALSNNPTAESRLGRFFCSGYLEVVDTTGKSTKLAAEPPSKILMVAFL